MQRGRGIYFFYVWNWCNKWTVWNRCNKWTEELSMTHNEIEQNFYHFRLGNLDTAKFDMESHVGGSGD